MQDLAGAKLIFSKQGRVQRNLVPVCECPAAFNAEARIFCVTGKVLNRVFDGQSEAIWQTDLYLLGEEMIRFSLRKASPS
jgi:hypothetical protein